MVVTGYASSDQATANRNWAQRSVETLSRSETDTDAYDFIEQTTRKAKRRKKQSNQVENSNGSLPKQTPTWTTVKSNTKAVKTKRPLLVGENLNLDTKKKLIAAKSLIRKSVFCIYNVQIDVSVHDITEFISSLDVGVISCRSFIQKKDNFEPKDRHAFCLCIDKSEEEKLLQSDQWPVNITVF